MSWFSYYYMKYVSFIERLLTCIQEYKKADKKKKKTGVNILPGLEKPWTESTSKYSFVAMFIQEFITWNNRTYFK